MQVLINQASARCFLAFVTENNHQPNKIAVASTTGGASDDPSTSGYARATSAICANVNGAE